jgi:hypothetical protein
MNNESIQTLADGNRIGSWRHCAQRETASYECSPATHPMPDARAD